jgi:predicted nucleic acid-binding protein
MIVVADTSVILNLCRVRHEHLLQQLFLRVLIPELVATEFARLAGARARFAGLMLPGWVEVLPTPESFPPEVANAKLDPGETAAITLCLNEAVGALLIDESLGRVVAARLGVRTIGVLGVLILARRKGLIPGVAPMLDRLANEAGFWVAPSLRERVLDLVNEKA